MPVVGIPVKRLRTLLGIELEPADLLRQLGHLGCDVEGFTELARVRCAACGAVHEMTAQEEIPPACEACGGDLRSKHEELAPLEVVRMELLAVRPDMFDPGGLARALRGYLDRETGAPHYPVVPPALRLTVDARLGARDSYRPAIACAVLTGVRLDDDALKVVMKLQENLHWAIGRDRKHASIGVYDLDRLTPDFSYTVEDPDAFRFVPLGAGGSGAEHARSLREILEHHPKGMGYAHLLAEHRAYPVLKDAAGQVLSMPPIINSEETKVTLATERFFIDVTGLAVATVTRTLHIMTSSLLENLPGTTVEGVEILGPGEGERRITPDFRMQEMTLDAGRASRLLGVPVSAERAAELLRRMRHDAAVDARGTVAVRTPAYRNDILHEVDLIEDVGIAYGYHNIPPSLVPTFTVGGARPQAEAAARARTLLCGLGYLEIMTLALTSPALHDDLLGRPASPAVKIANPASSEQTMLRTSLLAGQLETFRRNLTHPLPQQIFEIGEVTLLEPLAETGALDRYHLACGLVSPRAGFEEIKAVAEVILREFGCPCELVPLEEAPFMPGRAAEARPGDGDAGEERWALRFGEVHPEILERAGLQNPVVLLEGDLEILAGL
ncbi:MAG: phenylalanine--tRNA ligase subunit beta [Candidatus Eisenbacteria sp.]|nr:phenylalanine--tRNA ligase subunit beta [Candidatus Eisenbacteria bacterium]